MFQLLFNLKFSSIWKRLMIINQRFSYLFLAYYILVDSIKHVNGHGIHAHNSSKILDLLYYFLFFFNTFKK